MVLSGHAGQRGVVPPCQSKEETATFIDQVTLLYSIGWPLFTARGRGRVLRVARVLGSAACSNNTMAPRYSTVAVLAVLAACVVATASAQCVYLGGLKCAPDIGDNCQNAYVRMRSHAPAVCAARSARISAVTLRGGTERLLADLCTCAAHTLLRLLVCTVRV